jgi:hypothetical protein
MLLDHHVSSVKLSKRAHQPMVLSFLLQHVSDDVFGPMLEAVYAQLSNYLKTKHLLQAVSLIQRCFPLCQ